ncbi:MAG: histidine phosphatase family protein [Actinobacteria bacterium]|nr:histidine phosphatase family protein [Actinomycetota bacterium]
MTRRVVLWRHGQTAWNAEGRFQGQIDVPLDTVGRSQAAAAAAQLAQLPPTRIISSDLSRALVTAGELATLAGLEVTVDERLRETNAGEWQGLARDELMANFGAELMAWAAGSDLKPGGGERRSEVAARMVAAITDGLVELPSGGTLVVATHGGAARAAVGDLLGLPVEHWSILGVLTNCAWSVLTERVGPTGEVSWRLEEYNARSLPQTAFADDR